MSHDYFDIRFSKIHDSTTVREATDSVVITVIHFYQALRSESCEIGFFN